MLEGNDIICFANDWNGDPLSKKHIALRLAQKNRVLWVNSPGNRNPTAMARDILRVWKIRQRARDWFPWLDRRLGGSRDRSLTCLLQTAMVVPVGRRGSGGHSISRLMERESWNQKVEELSGIIIGPSGDGHRVGQPLPTEQVVHVPFRPLLIPVALVVAVSSAAQTPQLITWWCGGTM